ncbi:phage tail tape measure protein [Caulobacter segnis]|uniref:Phage tail tape measure protein n=1 Tax=Caulobacter segnis TaxID=88688 RepID=A0A2W5VBB3_9CAUL|nr:phage tail tape measure protein [Caulobacter segnis]PZR37189.1 MAG: phage tail tape measure protein [Caulobacter segnis]
MADRSMRLEIILAGVERITAPFNKAGQASKNLTKDLKAARDRLSDLEKTQRSLTGFQKLEQDIVATGAEMKKARATAAALERQFDETAKPTKRLMNETAKAADAVAKLEAKQREQVTRLEQVKGKLQAAGFETGDMARAQDKLHDQVREANRALDAQKGKLEELAERQARHAKASRIIAAGGGRAGKALAVSAVAGAGALGVERAIEVPARPAMNYEDALADINKVVDFKNHQEADAFGRRLLDTSTDMPGMQAEELATIAAAAGRSQIAKTELITFTEDAAKMGVAFDVAAEDAGSMMATWRTAFDLTQPKVRELADQINALTNRFGGSAGNVSSIVTRIGVLGEVAGVSAAQTAAMGAMLDKLGIQEEISATGIKNLLLTLTKGTAATKDQQAAFKALGLNAEQVSKDMQKNAGATIESVLERIGKLPKDKQAGLLTDLFGSESVAAIAPMLTQLDQLKARLQLVGDATAYTGSMNKEYLARIATTSGAVGLANNGLQAINIEMGQKLLPIITAGATKVAAIAKNFRAWTHEHPKLAQLLAKGAVVVGVFVAAVAAIALVVAPILAFLAALGGAAAALGVTVGALASTIAAVVAIIGVGIVAVIGLVKGWHQLVPIVGAVWAGVVQHFREAVAFITKLSVVFYEAGKHLMSGLVQGIGSGLGQVKDTIFNAGGKIVAWFKEKLGIHSPSRVFAGLGGFVMAGLDKGLEDGQAAPLARVRAIAGGLADHFSRAAPRLAHVAGAAALVATSASGQAAVSAPPAGMRPGAQAAAGGAPPIVINITINAAPGQDDSQLAKLVGDHVAGAVNKALAPTRRNAQYEDGWV